MLRKNIGLVLVLAMTLAISACEAIKEQCISTCLTDDAKLSLEDATRLSGAQAKAYVSGRTEVWFKGGGYYNPDGELKVKWRKGWQTGSWKVSADGEVCYEIPKFGKECHSYMDNAGTITMVKDGNNLGVKKMLEGNKLRGL